MSKNTRAWLAANIWWLTLIGVILGAVAVGSLIFVTFLAGAFLGIYGGVVGAAIGGILLIAALFSIAFMAVTVVLGLMAVSPLKAMQKKGWTLLFIIMLIHAVELAISFLLRFNLVSLVWGLLVTAIGVYFLLEIREYFTATHSPRNTATSKPAIKSAVK